MLKMFITARVTNKVIRTTSFKIDTQNRFLYFTNRTNTTITTTSSFK